MLIPSQVSELVSLCAASSNRYTIGSMRLHRKQDGQPFAAATDGHHLVVGYWQEAAPADFPLTEFDMSFVNGAGVNLQTHDVKAIVKGCAKGRLAANKPILANFAMEESSVNGTVRMGTNNLERINVSKFYSVEGSYPPVHEVIPQGVAVQPYEPKRHAECPFTHVRWKCSAGRLAKVLRAMADYVDGEQDSVTLTIPLHHAAPVRIDACDGSRSAIGIVMPVDGVMPLLDVQTGRPGSTDEDAADTATPTPVATTKATGE